MALKRFLIAILVLLGVIAPAATAFAAAPNVVVILADDQGWGDLSTNGNGNLATPNIDSLARDGAKFDRFFVQPVCSPTRAEMLTGRWHPRGGVWNVSTGGERLNLSERTIADDFRAAGYATGCFGKWHNGSQYPYHPLGRGFDEYYGYTSGHWGDYFSPPLDHNGRLVQGNGFIADDFTDQAIRFIAQNRGANKPFFCYLPLPTPHTPAQVPDAFYKKFANAELKFLAPGKGEDVAKTRAVMAMVENIDFNVGRVLAKLDELKIADDTIVLYFSDNGPNGVRWNGGMKGTKGSTDEGGVRSPLLIRWPGKIKPGTAVSQIAGAVDLLPTLCALCGVKPQPAGPLDGADLSLLLLDPAGPVARNWPDRLIFNHWSNKVSVRSQKYRLDAAGKLFDMVADSNQTRDIAAEQPDTARRLADAVALYRRDVLGPMKRGKDDTRPLSVGHAEMPMTMLPARDGEAVGNIRRSAKAPNCSFFTHWTAASDAITWDIEVATAGRYEVVVHYTCPAGDVGSTVQCSFGDAKTSTKVAEAHDPPLRGMENDRVPRDSESYVKDFKPLKLGTLELQPGRGKLTLRATDIPGKQVMDVRLVTMTLVK
jgi:arylsulfatase A-like enzyme